MSLRGSKWTAPAPGGPARGRRAAPSCPPARDHVRVRHHQPRRDDPAGAGHAEPARAAEDLHDARGRLLDLRVARDPARAAARRRRRALDPRERVEPAQRVQQRAGRRQDGVEPLQDRRALDLRRGSGSCRSGSRARRGSRPRPSPAQATGPRRGAPSSGAEAGYPPQAARGSASRTPRTARPAARRRAARRSARTRAPTASAPRRSRTSGPTRVPTQAPSARPANARTPETKPWAHPKSASSSTSPTMIQSTPVNRPSVSRCRSRPVRARLSELCRYVRRRVTMCGEHGHAPALGSPVLRPSPAPPPPAGVVAWRPGSRRSCWPRWPLRRRDRGRRRRRGPAPGRGPAIRRRLEPRRLRGDARAAHARGAEARPARSASPPPTATPRGRARSTAWPAGRAAEPADGAVRVPVRAAHADLRHAARQRRPAGRRAGRGRRDRVAAQPRPARPARAARSCTRRPSCRPAPRSRPRRHAARRGRGPALRARAARGGDRRPRRARAARARRRARAPRRPGRRAGRAHRARAPVRRGARRHGPAGGCSPATASWPTCSPRRATRSGRRSTRRPARRRHRARGPARRRSRVHPAAGRRGARAGRDRLLRAAAARLRVQDHHARGRRWSPATPSRRTPTRSRRRRRSRACELENANGESCGGSLETAFAHSCNSVFAPMGVDVGAEKLVKTAEQFGFNQEPALAGAARSTIPPAVGDRRRPGGRLDRDRPGQGARHPAAVRRRSPATIAEQGDGRRADAAQGRAPAKQTRMIARRRRAHASASTCARS